MSADIIRLLPDSVANQIAAGEVIQRPASVIKELVENSVDAGATSISIILKDAGRTLIQVVDNGQGMSPTDARMAFERHATSKISAAADIYALHTMGFRGEALPSVAAVAQIDLRTMRRDDTVGTRLLISESKFESQEPCSCVPGTNLMVKNIFFHMPARRKFLKKDSVELSHILREFERLALVNTNIDFTLIHNDVTLHQFRAGTLKQRIGALFGKHVEALLAPVNTETSLVKIDGFIGLPRSAKKRGALQYLFVNGRNMRHPFFHKAILKCYEHLVAPDSQPSYFINFEVDPATIDVNIHPQKHEIKFEHEQAIWQILEAAVRESLGKTQASGALDFDMDDAPDIPLFQPENELPIPSEFAPAEDFDPFAAANNTPFAERPAFDNERGGGSSYSGGDSYQRKPMQDWQKLYDNFNNKLEDAFQVQPMTESDPFADMDSGIFTPIADSGNSAEVQDSTAAGQVFMHLHNSYIVTPSPRGMMILSQRRAHIRILFERFLQELSSGKVAQQNLLFADDFEIPASQSALMEELVPTLSELGFTLLHPSPTCWSATAVPASLNGAHAGEILSELLEEFSASGNAQTIHRPLAMAMARAAAVKAHQPLSTDEMESIVAELFRCNEPSYTPDGLPTMTVIETDEISRRFNAF